MWSGIVMLENARSTLKETTSGWEHIGAFPLHGTARYGSVRFTFGGFPLGTVPGTWYFFSTFLVLFSTTSAEVPSDPYHYQNLTCKLC